MAASRSSGYRRDRSRMASAYLRASAARSGLASVGNLMAIASMYARSASGPPFDSVSALAIAAVRLLRPVVVDIEVVVGTERPRDAPVRHRRLRIELGRALERADRFLVVEAEDQVEALVEVALRLGVRRRDGVMVIPQPGQEPYGLVPGTDPLGGPGLGSVRASGRMRPATGRRSGGW